MTKAFFSLVTATTLLAAPAYAIDISATTGVNTNLGTAVDTDDTGVVIGGGTHANTDVQAGTTASTETTTGTQTTTTHNTRMHNGVRAKSRVKPTAKVESGSTIVTGTGSRINNRIQTDSNTIRNGVPADINSSTQVETK